MRLSKLLTGCCFLLGFALLWTACGKEDVSPSNGGNTPLSGTRYKDSVFTEVIQHKDIVYGRATTQAGITIDLSMNIYEPSNDTEQKRPLILLAHGGGFAEGSKEDFDGLAKTFATRGYVAATIGYRLMDAADNSLKVAVVDAVHDMRASVRFFTKDNAYKIHSDNIFIGGFSAGAVTALHYAYLDTEDLATAPEEVRNHLNANGGFSGNSGNPGAKEDIRGVINIAGGLFDAQWVDAGEAILYSIHGTADPSCGIDPDAASNPDGDFIQGSCVIHPIADSVGIVNTFKVLEGGDHGAYFSCGDCDADMRRFLFNNLSL